MENEIELLSKKSKFDSYKILTMGNFRDKTIEDGSIAKKDNELYAIKRYKIQHASAYDPNPRNFYMDAIESSDMSDFSKIYSADIDKENEIVSLVVSYPRLYGIRMTFRDVALSELDNRFEIMKKAVASLNKSIKTWTKYPEDMGWMNIFIDDSFKPTIERVKLTKYKNAFAYLYVLNLMALGFFDFSDRNFISYYVDAICDVDGNPVVPSKDTPTECKLYMEKMNIPKIFEFFREVENFIDFDKFNRIILDNKLSDFKGYNEEEIINIASKYGYKIGDDDMPMIGILNTAFALRNARIKRLVDRDVKMEVFEAIFKFGAFGLAMAANDAAIKGGENVDINVGENVDVKDKNVCDMSTNVDINGGNTISTYYVGKKKRFNNPSVDDF